VTCTTSFCNQSRQAGKKICSKHEPVGERLDNQKYLFVPLTFPLWLSFTGSHPPPTETPTPPTLRPPLPLVPLHRIRITPQVPSYSPTPTLQGLCREELEMLDKPSTVIRTLHRGAGGVRRRQYRQTRMRRVHTEAQQGEVEHTRIPGRHTRWRGRMMKSWRDF
jgi:hypothetical protein